MPGTPLYHLNLTLRGGVARISLNGFPVLGIDARRPISAAPPLNAFLVGADNVLTIEALPADAAGRLASAEQIEIEGAVAAFEEGDIVAPDASGAVVMPVELRGAPGAPVSPAPLEAAFVFDSEGASFPALFLEAEVITEPASLIAYAMRLKELAAASDAEGLAAEMVPKLRDYAAAYGDTEEAMRDELLAFLREKMFAGPMDLDFEAADLVAVPSCEGRIWEVRRRPAWPLFATMPDARGGRYQIPVHVARVDGALKVVR